MVVNVVDYCFICNANVVFCLVEVVDKVKGEEDDRRIRSYLDDLLTPIRRGALIALAVSCQDLVSSSSPHTALNSWTSSLDIASLP
jgi:hypothetical protein